MLNEQTSRWNKACSKGEGKHGQVSHCCSKQAKIFNIDNAYYNGSVAHTAVHEHTYTIFIGIHIY